MFGPFNVSIGAGGAGQIPVAGANAITSLAVDSSLNVCVQTTTCVSTVPLSTGIFGVLGISVATGNGLLSEGTVDSVAIFAEGGAGGALAGSISFDDNGNVTAGRGIVGIGGGGAGGVMLCTTNTSFCAK